MIRESADVTHNMDGRQDDSSDGRARFSSTDDGEQIVAISNLAISGVTVIEVSGEIDIATAPALRGAIEAAAEESVAIVSLRDVRYIDSSGLAVLVHEHRRRTERDQALLVVLPDNQAARVFELTRLTQLLTCFSDLKSALARARRTPAPPPYPELSSHSQPTTASKP